MGSSSSNHRPSRRDTVLANPAVQNAWPLRSHHAEAFRDADIKAFVHDVQVCEKLALKSRLALLNVALHALEKTDLHREYLRQVYLLHSPTTEVLTRSQVLNRSGLHAWKAIREASDSCLFVTCTYEQRIHNSLKAGTEEMQRLLDLYRRDPATKKLFDRDPDLLRKAAHPRYVEKSSPEPPQANEDNDSTLAE